MTTAILQDSIKQLIDTQITPNTRRFRNLTQIGPSTFFEGELVQLFPSAKDSLRIVSVATSKECRVSSKEFYNLEDCFMAA